MFAIIICLLLLMCTMTIWSSVFCVLIVECMPVVVNVMLPIILIEGKMSTSRTLADEHSSEMGQ